MDNLRVTARAVRLSAERRRGPALRAMLCLALPLLIGFLTGHPADGAQASFGGLAGLYVPDSPYRYRARVILAVGAGLTLAVFLGAVTGSHGGVAALVAGMFAAAASFICQTVELSPPREIMFVMALLAATAVPGDAAQALHRSALTAAGGVLAWLVSLAPALLGRARPETITIAAALAGVADLVDRIGSDDAPAARHTAVNAMRRARQALAQAGRSGNHRLTGIVDAAEDLLEAALRSTVEDTQPPDPALATRIRAAIPLIATPDDTDTHHHLTPLPQQTPLARAVGDLHIALRTQPPGPPTDNTQTRNPDRQGILTRVRAAGGRHSVIVPTAARIGIGVGVGFGLGLAFGIAHAFWIGLTACAVLQASNLRIVRSRFVHRLVGTILGVGIVFALLAWHPPLIVLILTAVIAQGIIESVITAHYGLAVIGITVLSLMLFHLAAPAEDNSSLIGGRLLDTALGAALALLLRTALWSRATSTRIPPRQATALDSISDVFAATWAPDHSRHRLTQRRRQLLADITALRVIQADALADTARTATATDLGWPVTVAVEKLAYIAYSVPTLQPTPTPRDAYTFLIGLHHLAANITDQTTPLMPAPSLPGYPRTNDATSTLTAAIARARQPTTTPDQEPPT